MKCKNFSRFFVMLAVPVIILFACFGAFSIDTSADVVTKSFTPQEFYDLIGDSLNFTYYDGTSYVDSTAYFEHTATISTLDSNGSYVYGIPCLLYYADVLTSINTNRDYDTVTIHPNFYFQNISSLSFSIYCSTGVGTSFNGSVSNSVYRSPSVDFYVDGARVHQNYTWYNSYGWCNFVSSDNDLYFLQAAYSWSSDSAAALITLGDVYFNGVDDQYDRIIFAITVPTISEDATLTAGQYVDPNSGSGGQTIINNNVDLTETHGFLSDIWEAITGIPSSILSGIQSIFIPSPGFLDDQLAEIQDSFAWYDDIKQIGADFSGAMENQANASAPVISIPTLSSRGHVYTERSEMVLDLSDYQEAVVSVRAILSVLLWIFFLWRLYCRLPDIIHGSGMIIGDGSRIMDELDNRESQNVNDDVNFHDHHIGR